MERHWDAIDAEMETQAKAINRGRQIGQSRSATSGRGKRSIGAKMQYRKQMPPSEKNIDRIFGSKRRSA